MKNRLIKGLKNANNRLLVAIELMPDNSKIDKWSRKEILAHIAGWYEEGVDGIPKILKGEKPASFSFSVNGYNKHSVEGRKNKSIPQIISEIKILHDQFLAQVQGLSESEMIGRYGTKLGEKEINVLWIINECISHDNSHAQELEKKI